MFTLRSNNSGFSLHIVLLLLASIAGVAIIGLFTKNQIEIQNQEKQFLAAQTEVNALGDKLAKVTNPDKHEASAYCSYNSSKYGKGDRRCSVFSFLLFKNTTYVIAAGSLINSKNLFPRATVQAQSDSASENYPRTVIFQLEDFDNPCGATLYYKDDNAMYDKSSLNLPFDIEPKDALIAISCSGEAKAEHFPVKK